MTDPILLTLVILFAAWAGVGFGYWYASARTARAYAERDELDHQLQLSRISSKRILLERDELFERLAALEHERTAPLAVTAAQKGTTKKTTRRRVRKLS